MEEIITEYPLVNFQHQKTNFLWDLAARISDKLSMGLHIKFYYYKLYEEINSTSLGFDIGALYQIK